MKVVAPGAFRELARRRLPKFLFEVIDGGAYAEVTLERNVAEWDVGVNGRPHTLGNVAPLLGPNTGLEDFFAWMRENFDLGVTWRDLEYIRSKWQGPLIVKGRSKDETA
jgi:isopentenyl diphosphate isomerase/L-lactate dehydrogenase-like FMN-dependent dehydrogenase